MVRPIALLFLALLASAGVWMAAPRPVNLAAFDANRVAIAEAAMWRDYYDRRFVSLFYRLYGVNRDGPGFSPLDSIRIAFAAADAARRFQPTKSRAAADVARPALTQYFALLTQGAPVRFDPHMAADLELDWWQARREGIEPDIYGLTIARVSSLLYGFDAPRLREAGIMRARAMAFRDARGEGMTEDDWLMIATVLREAYGLLRAAIDGAHGTSAAPDHRSGQARCCQHA